jgi:hypothetical protein
MDQCGCDNDVSYDNMSNHEHRWSNNSINMKMKQIYKISLFPSSNGREIIFHAIGQRLGGMKKGHWGIWT